MESSFLTKKFIKRNLFDCLLSIETKETYFEHDEIVLNGYNNNITNLFFKRPWNLEISSRTEIYVILFDSYYPLWIF